MDFDKPDPNEPHVTGHHVEPDIEMRDGLEEPNTPAEGKRELKGENLWYGRCKRSWILAKQFHRRTLKERHINVSQAYQPAIPKPLTTSR